MVPAGQAVVAATVGLISPPEVQHGPPRLPLKSTQSLVQAVEQSVVSLMNFVPTGHVPGVGTGVLVGTVDLEQQVPLAPTQSPLQEVAH